MEVQSGGLIRLKDFLEEAELQQYFELFRDFLKITKTTQLKYVNSVDLKELGLSKPEQRRYKKIYAKYFEKRYFSKIKRLLTSRKKHEGCCESPAGTPELPSYYETTMKTATKHIIPMEDITINKELGTGEFGVVQQGTWTNDNQRIQVAIKCLGNEKVQSNPTEFLKEAAVMHSIEHPSVVRLYGVVLHPDSMMLVTELAPLRSLLECLKEYALRESFTVTTLCSFAEQICDGMAYLESKRLIHRDLAARNILVFNKYKVKISDFGLSRALGVGKDYYQTNYNVNLKLPVAWCAAECITYLRFTSASDVWAYAVTLWEMFSYGFQPWAAFSGHQILTAIDEPNYQRLERPECCPENYYSTMMECWAHDPSMRPKFRELNQRLAIMRPTQVIAKSNSVQVEGRRANYLHYREGDIITVVGKDPNSNMCIGVLPNSACGLFDPETTTPFTPPYKAAMSSSNAQGVLGSSKSTGGLLTSTLRSSLSRSDSKRHAYTSKRTIERNMISSPQGEVKHTGHVGLDGAYFGDVSFLNPSDCSDPPPRQIVNPYKPSEDLEETPLLNPHSPSHLTGGGASALPYLMLGPMGAPAPPFNLPCRNHDQCDNTLRMGPGGSLRSKRLTSKSMQPTTSKSFMSKMKSATLGKSFRNDDSLPSTSNEHEYQEISDDTSPLELTAPDGSVLQKSQTDFSQSLIDEMECRFQSLNVPPSTAENQGFKKSIPPNQRAHTLGNFGKKKPNHCEIVKPMSAHEQKTLETAVALANELTTKSMNDLDAKSEKVPPSPNERSKFHFKFPSLGNQNTSQEQVKEIQGKGERRNFSQEAQSVPDLQSTITEESRLAYASLIEQRAPTSHAQASHAAAAGRAAPASSVCAHTHRYQHKTPLAPSPENHEMEQQMMNNDKDDQTSNILPLPSRGNKPQLIDKTRHIRIHPLVMTDAMLRRVDTVSRHSCSGSDAARLPAPHNSSSHEYQNLIYTPVGAADKREHATRNIEYNQPSVASKCQPEPDYQNLLMNSGIDICDGPSTNVSTNELSEDGISKSSVDSDTATDNIIAKYLETSANANNNEAGTSSENNHETTPEQTATDPDLGILLKDAPDHVSVEDLLEFADQKPLGRQRGAESDEVRILCKVLNYEMPKVTVEECMEALDHTEWRVHSALKLFRLRAAVGESVTLRECACALAASDNDVTQACALLNLAKPKLD